MTWKSSETVVRFLRRAGASGAVLELESRLVTRALRGQLNRIINAEEANLVRSVSAARRQLEAIQRLESSGRLDRLPEPIRAVADARRRTPEATLAELSTRLGQTRSHVQRALDRLESLSLVAVDSRARG